MAKISDEIREFIDDEDLYPGQIAGLRRIADRIDTEMVELPKDADGVPIHVGDTVYLHDGSKSEVSYIDLMPTNACIVCWTSDKKDVAFPPSVISHKPADSFERIADELDELVDAAGQADDMCEMLANFADRIRKLAKKEDKR